MKGSLLVIDDDEKLNRLLTEYLQGFGYSVTTCTSPSAGFQWLEQQQPNLIVLDVMLPEMDGFEVCKKLRAQLDVPIIMLTARGEIMDRIVGLEIGADDYLPKPFEPRELVARIQTVLRRVQSAPTPKENSETVLQFGELNIDLKAQRVELQNNEIELTTMEFATLSMLVRNAGEVLSRDQLLEELRGIECDAFNRSVDISISRLRQKLQDDPKHPQYIKTVWGSGYMFIGKGKS